MGKWYKTKRCAISGIPQSKLVQIELDIAAASDHMHNFVFSIIFLISFLTIYTKGDTIVFCVDIFICVVFLLLCSRLSRSAS